MRIMNKVCAGGLYSIRKAISLLIFGACVFMSSCKGSETTWSAEARSPDGKMIATARTIENSGFGTGGIWTAVYLNWTTGSQPPIEILELADGPSAPGDTVVKMKWLTPTHLELLYKGSPQSVGFQAVKWADVEISVRDLSKETSNPAH